MYNNLSTERDPISFTVKLKITLDWNFIYLFKITLLFSMFTPEPIRKKNVKNARHNEENLLIDAEVV